MGRVKHADAAMNDNNAAGHQTSALTRDASNTPDIDWQAVQGALHTIDRGQHA